MGLGSLDGRNMSSAASAELFYEFVVMTDPRRVLIQSCLSAKSMGPSSLELSTLPGNGSLSHHCLYENLSLERWG